MYKIYAVLAFFVGLVYAVSVTPTPRAHNGLVRSADLSLMKFLVQSRSISEKNPQRSISCFDYYVPLLNGIASKYESDYGICLDAATVARNGVDDNTAKDREYLEGLATQSCQLLQECTVQNSTVETFECYVNVGSTNSKTMYSISTNATDVLTYVREELRLIENKLEGCEERAQRDYVEDTAQAYEGLQSCLEGKTDIPTTSTTSTTTSTTSRPPSTA